MTREKIVAQLRLISGPARQHVTITDATEIYYDLRIFGQDLYDFLVWVANEFGVPVEIDVAQHAPRERMPPLLFRNWQERHEREKRPYKSLTVRDILGIVERGRSKA
jgi:hypothetical protein